MKSTLKILATIVLIIAFSPNIYIKSPACQKAWNAWYWPSIECRWAQDKIIGDPKLAARICPTKPDTNWCPDPTPPPFPPPNPTADPSWLQP